MYDPALYAGNAAQMWIRMAGATGRVVVDEPAMALTEIPGHRSARVVLRRPVTDDPGPIGPQLTTSGAVRFVIEDSFGAFTPPLRNADVILHMPVMIRPQGPIAAEPGAPVVTRVADPAALAAAERTMIEGFPHATMLPYRAAQALPPALLDVSGFAFWLAHWDGQPAAACFTYDDVDPASGRTLARGLYWVATLPEFRGRGLGRAVVSAALADRPDVPMVLVATPAGAPLYDALGFTTVSTAVWWRWEAPENKTSGGPNTAHG